MTDTITTADANVTDQAIGTLEYVDPSMLEIGLSVQGNGCSRRSR
jgi:hypothetical protein